MCSSPFRDGPLGRHVGVRSRDAPDRFDIRREVNQNRLESE